MEDGRSEIVVLNYNSDDDLDGWIRNFQGFIDDGIIRYVRERTARYFHASRAKNLAHLASTAEYLVNLDADNYIGTTIPRWREIWAGQPDAVIHGVVDLWGGTCGRIGLKRAHFLELGGYDEGMLPMAEQDLDLVERARALGLPVVKVVQEDDTPAFPNSRALKVKYCGVAMSFREMVVANQRRSAETRRTGRIRANELRRPKRVVLNFSSEVEL